MGAWSMVSDLIRETATEAGCEHPTPRYAGRGTAAAPATGLAKRHRTEQTRLVEDALTVGTRHVGRIGARKHKAGKPRPAR